MTGPFRAAHDAALSRPQRAASYPAAHDAALSRPQRAASYPAAHDAALSRLHAPAPPGDRAEPATAPPAFAADADGRGTGSEERRPRAPRAGPTALVPVAADVVAAVLAARGIWVLAHGDRAGLLWIAAGVAVAVLSSLLLASTLRRRTRDGPPPTAGGNEDEVEAWEPR